MEDKFIIGIAGGSGSGKTTFLNAIKAPFNPDKICFISLDNYYHPRDAQKTDAQGIKNFDLPESLDIEALLADLSLLMAGKSLTKKKYTFNNKLAEEETITIDPAPIIVIEGLFVFHYPRLRDLLNLKLYIHAKDSLKLIRRIKRDQSERNYPLEDVIYRYENHVLPSYEKYISAYKEEADIIINNNKHMQVAIDVVIAYLNSLCTN